MSKLAPLGKVLYFTHAARFYHNGDGSGLLWRYWHPLTWVLLPVVFVASVLIEGFPATWKGRHEIGIGMNPYFVNHPERLVWYD